MRTTSRTCREHTERKKKFLRLLLSPIALSLVLSPHHSFCFSQGQSLLHGPWCEQGMKYVGSSSRIRCSSERWKSAMLTLSRGRFGTAGFVGRGFARRLFVFANALIAAQGA